jgi:hypothetical protein
MNQVMVWCVALWAGAVQATQPVSLQLTAERFLKWHQSAAARGAPDAQALKALQPVLTPALHCLLQQADVLRSAIAKARPDEKPPFVEGDMFSSLWEGPSAFRIASVESQRHTARVLVRFVHAPGAGQAPVVWQDALHLQRTASGWRVADVEYLGKWDFAQKGRLRAGLVAALGERDPAAPAVPAAVKTCLHL